VKGGRYDTPNSGTIIRSESSVNFGGYGGLLALTEANEEVIWSARPLLRWNVANPLTGPNGDPDIGYDIGPPLSGTYWSGQDIGQYGIYLDSYGLCIDSQGNVWNTQLSGNLIRKYAPDGTFLGAYSHGDYYAQGCVVDAEDNVWVAHSLYASSVGRLAGDGTYIGTVPVGSGPTGVAVDAAGKVWSANYHSNTLSRIDPSLGTAGAVDLTVNLGAGANPYNYGDMTGSTNIAPPNSGSWTVVHHGDWKRIEWTAQVPGSASLVVEARSRIDDSSPWSPPIAVTSGEDLSLLLPQGEDLEVRVLFTRDPNTESPILYDLSILSNQPPDCSNAFADPGMLWPPNHKFADIAITGVTDPDGDAVTLEVTRISQDEPLDELGDGNTEPDGAGVGTPTAQVRQERQGGENGRVYVIEFKAVDEHGDSCDGSVEVCVPHDKSKPETCVKDDPMYDSVTGDQL
jgi:hypothetical protein